MSAPKNRRPRTAASSGIVPAPAKGSTTRSPGAEYRSINSPSRRTLGPGFAERFTREARALARLSHPNIVAVHEFGQVNGLHYFIMEFVDGVNLRQLEQSGKLSPREALQIIPQICEALQFAHDKGIVHRDIKPENVLLDKKSRVKIADFGIAKILGQAGDVRLTGAKDVVGTPHYMAPEQIEHPQTVDHRADIYSLGLSFTKCSRANCHSANSRRRREKCKWTCGWTR